MGQNSTPTGKAQAETVQVLRTLRDTLIEYVKHDDPNLVMNIKFNDETASGGTPMTINAKRFLERQATSIVVS